MFMEGVIDKSFRVWGPYFEEGTLDLADLCYLVFHDYIAYFANTRPKSFGKYVQAMDNCRGFCYIDPEFDS